MALVIGGASGLGRASAQACADEGAQVMIADLNAESGREAAAAIGRNGGAASFVEVDATDEESVREGVLVHHRAADHRRRRGDGSLACPVTGPLRAG